jgi:hypothetical protein
MKSTDVALDPAVAAVQDFEKAWMETKRPLQEGKQQQQDNDVHLGQTISTVIALSASTKYVATQVIRCLESMVLGKMCCVTL